MALTKQEPLYEQVYELLWGKFLSGEIAPRARIGDVEWAERLNVSRTPVREALRKIEHEGIIAAQDNGRYQVRDFKADDLRNLYRCRAALEGIAAFDAAERISVDDLKRLKSLVDRTEAAISSQSDEIASTCNTEFHGIIIAASANDDAARVLAFLRRTIQFARGAVRSKTAESTVAREQYFDHLSQVVRDHRRIVAALKSKDPEAAEARMREHLRRTSQHMATLVADEG
jgi:DNA-binding GntR family transcriptional regulator